MSNLLHLVAACSCDSYNYSADTDNLWKSDWDEVLIVILTSGYWKASIVIIDIDSTTSCSGVVNLSIYLLLPFPVVIPSVVILSCPFPDNLPQVVPFRITCLRLSPSGQLASGCPLPDNLSKLSLSGQPAPSCPLPDNYPPYSLRITLS